MTIEGNNSKEVYFDPLIKLNYNIVNTTPKGLPETEKYTQFFNKNQFNSLIQRTLSSGSQVKRNLVQAKKNGIVDNNIRITLNTLFKSGNPFYLNGKRFTVYNYEWETGDWEIHSTKSEKMQKVLKTYTSPVLGNTSYSYPYPNPYYQTQTPYSPYQSYSQQQQRASRSYVPGSYNLNKKYPEITGIDPEALTGSVDPGISKLEKAAIVSGEDSIFKPQNLPSPPSPPPKPPKPIPIPIQPTPTPTPTPKKDEENGNKEEPKPKPKPKPNPFIPRAKDKLCQQFLNYYQEGFSKGFIKNDITPSYMEIINQWTIQPNKASGDCFFEALRDSLNGHNEKSYDKNKIIINPYFNKATGLYSVSSLRKAVADYLESPRGIDLYNSLVAITQEAINSLADPINDLVPNQFRFMVDGRNNIFTQAEVAERISRSSTPSERRLREVVMDTAEYYWGDTLAVSICEEIFQTKIVLISTKSKNKTNGSLVEFRNKDGTIIKGTAKNLNAVDSNSKSHTLDVETIDYATYPEIPINTIKQIPRYSIYCLDTDTDLTSVNRFIFILYSNDNHFESLYLKRSNDNHKYLFNSSDIPSYIKYMIFENCYRPLSPSERDASSYGEIKALKPYLKGMIEIYNAKIANGPDALKFSNKKLLNGGGEYLTGGQNYPRYYIDYSSSLTYYIVIDLEVYPGDNIPLQTKASMACQIRYEKMRQSYADLFGLVYQPKELSLNEELNKKYLIKKSKTQKNSSSYNNKNKTRRL